VGFERWGRARPNTRPHPTNGAPTSESFWHGAVHTWPRADIRALAWVQFYSLVERKTVKTQYIVALAMLTGAGLASRSSHGANSGDNSSFDGSRRFRVEGISARQGE